MLDPAAFRQTTDRNIEMQRIRLLVFAAMALMALGFAASSASAAPTSTSALLLAGDSFPVKFSTLPAEPNTIKTELQNAAGSLEGEGVAVEGEILKATGGLYKAIFLNVVERGTTKKCNSLGDSAGQVLVGPYNFLLVHDLTENTGGGILFEVDPARPLHIECEGGVLIEIKGNVLGLLKPVGTELLWTGGKSSLECKVKGGEEGIGVPKINKYFTSLLASPLTAVLLANFGTGFKGACELIGLPLPVELGIDVNKMIELMQ
jgi:hypothetical protein